MDASDENEIRASRDFDQSEAEERKALIRFKKFLHLYYILQNNLVTLKALSASVNG